MKKIIHPCADIPENYKSYIETLEKGDNVIILGEAGTGKSTFLNFIRTNQHPDLNIITLSPTGIAALNVNGQSIHSFFNFDSKILLNKDAFKKYPLEKREILESTNLIIIDEISMVRADIFKTMDSILKFNLDTREPFGGIQIILMGDVLQLPPVVTPDERKFFGRGSEAVYPSEYFFDTDAYKNGNFKPLHFNKIYRQTDLEFIKILNSIRKGITSSKIIDSLNKRIIDNKPDFEKDNPIFLCSTNKNADDINEHFLQDINKKEFIFEGKITGKFKDEKRLPSPQILKLKVGAKVIFTKNDPEKKFVNGTIGEVIDIRCRTIYVKLCKEYNFATIEVPLVKWEKKEYVLEKEAEAEKIDSKKSSLEKIKEIAKKPKPKLEMQVVGTYEQYPLNLAWAITIHKSQGQTLDSVLIDLDKGCFTEGQVYVALSRCKTFEKLYLLYKLRSRDVKVNNYVLSFLETLTERKEDDIENNGFGDDIDFI